MPIISFGDTPQNAVNTGGFGILDLRLVVLFYGFFDEIWVDRWEKGYYNN